MKRSFLGLLTAALVAALASLASPAALADSYKASMEAAESDLESGEFENALAELQAAVDATEDLQDRAEAHALRARCYAGLGNSDKLHDAFVSILENDPSFEFDADDVSPRIIEEFESLKATLQAEVSIKTNRPGAMILVDGKHIGTAPMRTEILIGQHEFEIRDPAGYQFAKRRAVIRARQIHDLYIPIVEDDKGDDDFMGLAEAPPEEQSDSSVDVDTDTMRSASGGRAGGRRTYFLIDLRYTFGGAFGSSPSDLPEDLKLDTSLKPAGFELGLGVSGRDLLAMVSGTFDGENWGATVKFGCHFSLVSIFGLQASIDLPMVFPDGNFYMGAGASVGLFLRPIHLISIFVEGSYRYFFVTPSTEKLTEDKSQFFGHNIWAVSAGLRFFI